MWYVMPNREEPFVFQDEKNPLNYISQTLVDIHNPTNSFPVWQTSSHNMAAAYLTPADIEEYLTPAAGQKLTVVATVEDTNKKKEETANRSKKQLIASIIFGVAAFALISACVYIGFNLYAHNDKQNFPRHHADNYDQPVCVDKKNSERYSDAFLSSQCHKIDDKDLLHTGVGAEIPTDDTGVDAEISADDTGYTLFWPLKYHKIERDNESTEEPSLKPFVELPPSTQSSLAHTVTSVAPSPTPLNKPIVLHPSSTHSSSLTHVTSVAPSPTPLNKPIALHPSSTHSSSLTHTVTSVAPSPTPLNKPIVLHPSSTHSSSLTHTVTSVAPSPTPLNKPIVLHPSSTHSSSLTHTVTSVAPSPTPLNKPIVLHPSSTHSSSLTHTVTSVAPILSPTPLAESLTDNIPNPSDTNTAVEQHSMTPPPSINDFISAAPLYSFCGCNSSHAKHKSCTSGFNDSFVKCAFLYSKDVCKTHPQFHNIKLPFNPAYKYAEECMKSQSQEDNFATCSRFLEIYDDNKNQTHLRVLCFDTDNHAIKTKLESTLSHAEDPPKNSTLLNAESTHTVLGYIKSWLF